MIFDKWYELARETVRAETDNWAGRSNFLGLTALFVLLFAPAFIFDIVQATVRMWDATYTTGLPSSISIARNYGVLMLLCVICLGVIEVLRIRRP